MQKLDKFIFVKDLYMFCRQLTFKILYQQPTLADGLTETERQVFMDLLDLLKENEETLSQQEGNNFPTHLPSQSTPSLGLCPAINIFFHTVLQDIKDLQIDQNRGNNISKQEQEALKALSLNKSFIIREADKGGNVVLWAVEDYVMEAKNQLNNKNVYFRLPSNPTDIFKKKFDRLITEALHQNIIDKKEAKYLKVEVPVTPTFYLVPKIHKSLTKPPGRPIVAGIGGLCERACTYLDFFLQPLVLQLDSYIRDSMHLIEQLQQVEVHSEILLVTMDVESLYTNIAHDLGIEAVAYHLNNKKENLDRLRTRMFGIYRRIEHQYDQCEVSSIYFQYICGISGSKSIKASGENNHFIIPQENRDQQYTSF
ncbi:uncharacterized protein [Engystomops pustulosus]|uniref:uncharacterized protein n=1 Tax=Engystomops pustulosus TaxID=76066 RepID=UPI003AFA322D